MDATVTAKFYRIMLPSAAAPRLDAVLSTLFARKLAEREIDVDEGITLRLEILEQEARFLSGQFCRIQKANIPPSAGDDGLAPTVLAKGSRGLGHVAAFRYHIPTRLMLLQINRNCAMPSRLSVYFGVAEGRPLYVLEPVLRTDVLKRLKKATIKAFSVKFAEPLNIEALDDEQLSAVEGVRRAAEVFNAGRIEITISAGPKKKRKKKPLLRQLASRSVLSRLSNADGVEGLQALISIDDESEWVNLLEEQLRFSEVLELDSLDPAANYDTRKSYLAKIFNANLDDLKAVYGARDGND